MTRLSIRTILLGLLIAIASRSARAQVDVNVSIGGFYDELAPYGRWVDCSYGQCWVPGGVSADWQPYTNGQWIYTSYGWTWASSDPWGASPYHYGSWAPIEGYGWGWVPGTVWAPAWVTWSYNANYVGWAPLPPSVVIGASGYAGGAVVLSPARYVFVPTNHFAGVNVASVRVPTLQSETIFRQTTQVTKFSVTGGIVRNTAIPLETIQRAGGGRIETRDISAARTAPRAFAAHGTGPVPVVAPAGEIKAAVGARPQPHPAPAAKSADRATAPKAREKSASPAQPKGEAPAPAVAEHRPQGVAPRPPAAAHPVEKHDGSPVPMQHGQEPKAAPAQAPRPAVHAAEPAKPAPESKKPESEKPPQPKPAEKDKEEKPGR